MHRRDADATTNTWVDFQGQHIAHYENGETYFVHSGRLGTAGIVTDYTGAVIQDELHYPWGQEWTSAGTITEERFASLNHRDSATNLDPTHFRMYSSDQGRWLTPDPAQADIYNPQSMSRYAYATGNPSNFLDPTGLGPPTPCMIDGQPGFCTTSTASGGIDLTQLSSMQQMASGALVAQATALMGDYIVAKDTPLNPFAQSVFSQVYSNTSAFESPSFYAGWYGASAAGPIGYDIATGGDLTMTAVSGAETLAPGIVTTVSDFASGFLGSPTGSWAGTVGYVIGTAIGRFFH